MDPNQQPIPQPTSIPPVSPASPVTGVAPTAAAPAQPAQPASAAPAVSAAEEQMTAELEASRIADAERARLAAEQAAATQAAADAAASKSKNKTMLISLICSIVVAIAGIVFGVVMLLMGNSQADSLNKQITTLKQTNNTLQSQVISANPVIASGEDSTDTYELTYTMRIASQGRFIQIKLLEGAINSCTIGSIVDGNLSFAEPMSCAATGLEGEIYQIITIGRGQSADTSRIGFLMTDGTVHFTSNTLADLVANPTFDASNVLTLDGFVINALEVDAYAAQGGGFVETVFVMSDGSIVPYEESMLR
ncbi:hypothetical protein IKG68_00125 [Candidatus Saccharibacteria bacterium]|nr:hypothetical protein [Candidatus Saccharibacteria bacterium]